MRITQCLTGRQRNRIAHKVIIKSRKALDELRGKKINLYVLDTLIEVFDETIDNITTESSPFEFRKEIEIFNELCNIIYSDDPETSMNDAINDPDKYINEIFNNKGRWL